MKRTSESVHIQVVWYSYIDTDRYTVYIYIIDFMDAKIQHIAYTHRYKYINIKIYTYERKNT